jgi:hypothetical protein
MNKPLQISLLLNAALLGFLIFVWTSRPPAAVPVIPQATPAVPPPPVVSTTIPPVVPSARPAPLRWSQLYSSDYHNYVKNLRGIGCPEPSVRAIVTADVDSVYQLIANQLEQKLGALAKSPLADQLKSTGTEQALRSSLQKLPAAEAAKIADLLGLKSASTAAAAGPATAASAAAVPMPLVMQNIDSSTLNLTEEQTRQVAQIKQDFLKQAGDARQDPNDPDSQARSRTAQSDADNMLLAMLGNELYTQYEVAAHQAMLEQIEEARR